MENATSRDRGGHGDLSRNAVVLENSVELRRPRAEVFDYCSDIRSEREWNPTMRSVELLTPGPLRVGSVYHARWKGGPANTLECVKFDRPSCWVHDSVSKMWRVRFEGRVRETADGSRLSPVWRSRRLGPECCSYRSSGGSWCVRNGRT